MEGKRKLSVIVKNRKVKWVPLVGPCQDMPLSKQPVYNRASARDSLGEGGRDCKRAIGSVGEGT